MMRKATTTCLVMFMIGAAFTVLFFGTVTAMTDDHNLSGVVWKNDGSAPADFTNFCIWVNHSGSWNRFPDTGWAQTDNGTDGLWWYSFVLPDKYYDDLWVNGDQYMVQVDGTPWGDYDGNTTSNGTGSLGDPFPAPYDPANPSNSINIINYSAGGGFANEQQWDVRTVAPIDLVPSNVRGDGVRPSDQPFGIPVFPNTDISITFNVTNLGLVDSGSFWVTLWNCSSTGQNIGGSPIAEFPVGSIPGGVESIEFTVPWFSPASPGDYYVNITVDSHYEVTELSESNNLFLFGGEPLHFKIGSDLVVIDVFVNGLAPTDPIYVTPGDIVQILASAMNVGISPTGGQTWIALYNLSGANGPPVPGSDVQLPIGNLDPGVTSPVQSWNWTVPIDVGDFYVNISVDFQDDLIEANEDNNDFTIHFEVAIDLVPGNITGNGASVLPYIMVTPLELVVLGAATENIGPSGTGPMTFIMTFTNCTAAGVPLDTPFFISSTLGPVPSGGFSQEVFSDWITPTFDGSTFDYYVKVTVDYTDSITEVDEGNNEYIIQLKLDAPDLTFDDLSVEVAGISVADYQNPSQLMPPFVSDIPVEVPMGEDVYIWATIMNLGGIDMAETSNVTYYNVSGVGQPPTDQPFWESPLTDLNSGESSAVFGIWPNPMVVGTYYVNISIDYNGIVDFRGKIIELNEFNNTFTLIIDVTPIPVTTLHTTDPTLIYNSTVRYITSTTDINFTVLGPNPPFYTWYRVINVSNGSEARGWTNYTAAGPLFNMEWGEGTFRIEFNSTDSVGAVESTKVRFLIVDDSDPESFIDFGMPRYQGLVTDLWNITSTSPITLTALDNPPGTSAIGIDNACGLDNIDKPGSGIFYRIQSLGNATYMTDWLEASIISFTAGIYTVSDFTLPSVWADGYYTVWYNCIDNLGHQETMNSVDVYLDNTGPTTSIAVGDPQYVNIFLQMYVTSDTDFTLDALETTGSGVDASTIQFRITFTDGGISSSWTPGTVFDIAAWFSQGDGNYNLQFVSMDNLGNSGPTGNLNIYVDDTGPVAALLIDEPRYRVNSTHMWNITSQTEISIQTNDGFGCGANYSEYRIFNSSLTTGLFLFSAPFDLSFNSVGITLDDGEYRIEYINYDYLGNLQVFANPLYLDNTPPETQISEPTAPSFRAQTGDIWNITAASTFTLSADDGPGCGVNFTHYRITNSTYDSGWLTYTGDFALPTGLADGIYTIEYGSEDYLLNAKTESTDINLETTGPVTVIDWIHTQDDWNTEQNAWDTDFSTLFTLTADDGQGSGVDLIEYRIRTQGTNWTTWQTYTGSFNLTLLDHGYWDHTIEFRATDNLGNMGPTDDLEIYIEGDLVPPRPPVLTLRIDDNDIILEWIPSPDDDIDHYLIYRSTSKTEFDFSNPWRNTLVDNDFGVLSLRTSWNDTEAVDDSAEYYYALRGVDHRGNRGYTSNIAGKVTMTFEKGYNTFSLPLEPFSSFTASQMLESEVFADDRDTIYMHDSESQQWLSHPKFLPSYMDDFTIDMGEGYMLLISEEEISYTFTGSSSTAIRFMEGVGDDTDFRDGLQAAVSGGNVELTWVEAPGATGYTIYRGETRMGTVSLTDYDLESIGEEPSDVLMFTDDEAVGDEYYYLVVAKDDNGERSSTYSVGVRTYEFNPGYTLFALELEPQEGGDVVSVVGAMFSEDSSALFYYDEEVGSWRGHPRFLPENINNHEVSIGEAYFVYVHDDVITYALAGD